MKKIAIVLLLVIAGSSMSCKKILEEKPYAFVSADQLGTSTEADAKIWVNGCLNTLISEFFIYGVWNRPLEVDADDITGKDYAFSAIGAGNFNGSTDMNTFWSAPYVLISRSDVAISNLKKFTLAEAPLNNALGQCYFLKAWAYFILVQSYGPVPVFKTPVTESGDIKQPRASVAEVYAYIIENLKLAEADLYSRNDATWESGRLSKEAAKTLLAKVYLTMASGSLAGAQVTVLGGKQSVTNGTVTTRISATPATYTKEVVAGYEGFNSADYFRLARDKAQEVMTLAAAGSKTGLFGSVPEIWSIGNRNGKEHLWSLNAISGDETFGNIISYQYVGQLQDNGALIGQLYGMTDHWYDLLDNKRDQRARWGVVHSFRLYSAASLQWYPRKEARYPTPADPYDFGYDGGNAAEDAFHTAMLTKYTMVTNRKLFRADVYYPFMRYAETYLIFAEAENELNGSPSQAAYDAVNEIRFRAAINKASGENLKFDMGSFDKQGFRSMVLQERQRELAMEGSRRFDLLRWGIYLQAMNAIAVDANSIIKRRERKHLLFPIPITEINANTSIKENNPGW